MIHVLLGMFFHTVFLLYMVFYTVPVSFLTTCQDDNGQCCCDLAPQWVTGGIDAFRVKFVYD